MIANIHIFWRFTPPTIKNILPTPFLPLSPPVDLLSLAWFSPSNTFPRHASFEPKPALKTDLKKNGID